MTLLGTIFSRPLNLAEEHSTTSLTHLSPRNQARVQLHRDPLNPSRRESACRSSGMTSVMTTPARQPSRQRHAHGYHEVAPRLQGLRHCQVGD